MVKVSIGSNDAVSARADVLVVTMREGETSLSGEMGKAARSLDAMVAKSDFGGKEGKTRAFDAPRGIGAKRVLVVGLGRRHDPSVTAAELSRRAAGLAVKKAAELGATKLAFVPPVNETDAAVAAAEGALLADYTFGRYKSGNDEEKKVPTTRFSVLATGPARTAARKALKRVESIVEGVKLARDLGNEPSNELTPRQMAQVAKQIAADRANDGITCKVLGPKEIERLGMGAYLAVNQGSEQEPRFIHLTYKPAEPAPRGTKFRRIAIVGKGLTFDSGGISIKPSAGMEDMKMDMCGSATVLGLFRCLPDLGIQQEVHGFIAATDNMPSGSAIKPGDIVKSMAGRTIEVINTDAEGRLTLVDAITYALKTKPNVVIDLATLTGACAVALGSASGIMSNDRDLMNALWEASDRAGERAWPLPLFADYRSQVKSEFADVKNVGERYGGALTAGLFIQEWVPEDLPWAHLDIAGSAWTHAEHPNGPKGATGVGVRTLAAWLDSLSD